MRRRGNGTRSDAGPGPGGPACCPRDKEKMRTREVIETESGTAFVIVTPKECHSQRVTLFGGQDHHSLA